MTLRGYIFVSFEQINFKLGNCTNLQALFPVESMSTSLCQKLKKKNFEKSFEPGYV